MKFELLRFLMYLKQNFFKESFHDTEGSDTPAKNEVFFPRQASVDKLSALENFVTFFVKTDWRGPFLIYRSCIPHFYKNKGRLSQIISKVAVWKGSLK